MYEDSIVGVWAGDDVGTEFTCELVSGHVHHGPFTWAQAPEPPAGTHIGGLAEELGLAVELPAALKRYEGRWVEYGVLEAAYATAQPTDWAGLVARYGHTAIHAKRYSASAYLGLILGQLSKNGAIELRFGPATGRWNYNSQVSYVALSPAPDWDDKLTWEASGLTVEYVPGQTEV